MTCSANYGARPAPTIRARRPGRPIREVVLETLTELRWPQNAGFLEEYLWAKRQLQLDSRAFAPLRRDERRAWDHTPGARPAYIVPVLNPDGSANPRWISRVRLGTGAAQSVASAQDRNDCLTCRRSTPSPAGPARPTHTPAVPVALFDALLERYANQFLGIEPPPVAASADEVSTMADTSPQGRRGPDRGDPKL